MRRADTFYSTEYDARACERDVLAEIRKTDPTFALRTHEPPVGNAASTVVADVPTSEIYDWTSFHSVFAEALGFASYYGRNNNAFLDILGAPQAPDVAVNVPEGGLLVISLDESGASFAARCPEQYAFLVEAAAHLSHEARRLGQPGAIGNTFVALAFA